MLLMNGPEPKIEIFKPFGAAFELVKKVLFQPFDLKNGLSLALPRGWRTWVVAAVSTISTTVVKKRKSYTRQSAKFRIRFW